MMLRALVPVVLFTSMISGEIFPVAVSALGDGRLAVADSRNRFLIVNPQSRQIQEFNLPSAPIDITASDAIFLVLRGPTLLQSVVGQYTAEGKKVRSWSVSSGLPSGVSLGRSQKTLYVTALPASVYQLDLNGDRGGVMKFVAEVPGANGLGALAADPRGDIVYVADPFEGKLFGVSLSSHKVWVVTGDLGEPTALAIGRDGKLLYIADRAKRSILTIRLDVKDPKPAIFWKSKEDLREPVGLTFDGANTLWVADRAAKALFGISPDGRLKAKVP